MSLIILLADLLTLISERKQRFKVYLQAGRRHMFSAETSVIVSDKIGLNLSHVNQVQVSDTETVGIPNTEQSIGQFKQYLLILVCKILLQV